MEHERDLAVQRKATETVSPLVGTRGRRTLRLITSKARVREATTKMLAAIQSEKSMKNQLQVRTTLYCTFRPC